MNGSPFSLIAVFNDSSQNFKGNTSSVVFLDNPVSDEEMQHLAAEFNQPATTYLWKGDREDQFHVRWFAPDEEIGLCGHGSLAAVAYLTERFVFSTEVELLYREGSIRGKKVDSYTCRLLLKPISVVSEETPSTTLKEALGIPVLAQFTTGNKDIVLTESEADVKSMRPDFAKLRELETFGYAVTAPGEKVDFVSRTFVPHVQQLEDPATGSSHAALVPFWSQRLGKNKLVAHQLSKRGGKFLCEINADQVSLSGAFQVIAEGKLK